MFLYSVWSQNHYKNIAILYVPAVSFDLQKLWCAPLQCHRATLCTIDLHCAPLTCNVHHGAEGGSIFLEVA